MKKSKPDFEKKNGFKFIPIGLVNQPHHQIYINFPWNN